MRYTYRYKKNQDYWSERWANLPVDDEMSNELIYPLKNAISTIKDDKDGKIFFEKVYESQKNRIFEALKNSEPESVLKFKQVLTKIIDGKK